MDETGVVTKVDGVTAYVLVEKKSACEHCTAGTCDLSGQGALIEAINEAGAQVGQRVRVHLRDYTYVSGSLFFYGIPALALIAGAILGKEFLASLFPGMDPEGVSAITAFSCMGLSLIVVKLWSRGAEKKTAYQPVVEEVLDEHRNLERGNNIDGEDRGPGHP